MNRPTCITLQHTRMTLQFIHVCMHTSAERFKHVGQLSCYVLTVGYNVTINIMSQSAHESLVKGVSRIFSSCTGKKKS